MSRLQRVIREPLAHFLLIGLALFLLFDVVSDERGGSDRRIVVNDATVAGISQTFQATWQRPPSPDELRGLIDNHVRDEILYREGVGLGLDRDDTVIRRRVLQKLEVLSEETAGSAAPADADLENYLQRNAARYQQPAILDFEQVFFDPARRGARLDADIDATLKRLRAGAEPATAGDASLLPAQVSGVAADLVARDFGEPFAAALIAQPVGEWRGPLTSAFGVHLVRVARLVPAREARLAEVRAAVERDWESERRARAKETYYEGLRRQYDVVMEARVLWPGDNVAGP